MVAAWPGSTGGPPEGVGDEEGVTVSGETGGEAGKGRGTKAPD